MKLVRAHPPPQRVPVLDADHDPFGVFLVMDYIEGDTLSGLGRASVRSGGSLPLGIGLRVLLDALAGLHAAHELRDEEGRALHLVHRDFSPQNILVGVDGLARLADFGIAKVASRLAQTATGMVKGKFSYMSPEQARARPLDRRSDLWSAGVIAWEICAGRRLHEEGNDAATLLEIVSRAPPRLRTLRPDLPAALEDVVAARWRWSPADDPTPRPGWRAPCSTRAGRRSTSPTARRWPGTCAAWWSRSCWRARRPPRRSSSCDAAWPRSPRSTRPRGPRRPCCHRDRRRRGAARRCPWRRRLRRSPRHARGRGHTPSDVGAAQAEPRHGRVRGAVGGG